MRGLSVRQPWAHAIAHFDKRFENRDWPTCYYRGPLAIHASKTRRVRDEVATLIDMLNVGVADEKDLGGLTPRAFVDVMDRGAIIAVAQVIDWVSNEHQVLEKYADRDRRFYGGSGALVLDDVRVLAAPVPCRGALGLWFLEPSVFAEVDRRVAQKAS